MSSTRWPLAATAVAFLLAVSPDARAQDDGLPVDVARKKQPAAKLPGELPKRVADWPPRFQFDYLKLRAERAEKDPERVLRLQYLVQLAKLQDAGLDGAVVDEDLSGPPARWPIEYRVWYASLLDVPREPGETFEAAKIRAVRGLWTFNERMRMLVGGAPRPEVPARPLLAAASLPGAVADWPYEWQRFAATLAGDLAVGSLEPLSEAGAAKKAVELTRTLYYPKNRARGVDGPPQALTDAIHRAWDAVSGFAQLVREFVATPPPSETQGINSKLVKERRP